MNAKLRKIFEDIETQFDFNQFVEAIEIIGEQRPAKRYHDAWLKGVYMGLRRVADVFAGETFPENKEIYNKYDGVAKTIEDEDKNALLLSALFTIIATEEVDLEAFRESAAATFGNKDFDRAYM